MSGNFDATLAREMASAEAHALTSALQEAFDATLRAPDLPPEEVRTQLLDVLGHFANQWERRIPGWTVRVDADSHRIDADFHGGL